MPALPTQMDIDVAAIMDDMLRRRGVTVNELAGRVPITRARLYTLFNGTIRWWFSDLKILCDEFGVSPEMVMRAAGYGGSWPPIRDAIEHAPDLDDEKRSILSRALARAEENP